MMPWPPVVSLDTPLALYLCPHVGRGLMVICPEATQTDFDETVELTNVLEWTITDDIVGVNADGCEVVELTAEPTDTVTMEAMAGANEQLLALAGLTPDAE